MTRTCSKCGQTKPVEEFSKNKAKKSGYNCQCKECYKEYYQRNKRRYLDQQKEYYQKNKEAIKEKERLRSQTPEKKYTSYKASAKHRGKDFTLTLEEFKAHWQKPCVYCGIGIETIGLDRVDNEEGYHASNVVACCSACNVAKAELTQMEFIALCQAVAQRWS